MVTPLAKVYYVGVTTLMPPLPILDVCLAPLRTSQSVPIGSVPAQSGPHCQQLPVWFLGTLAPMHYTAAGGRPTTGSQLHKTTSRQARQLRLNCSLGNLNASENFHCFWNSGYAIST